MPRYSKKQPISPETAEEALKIAKGTQKPGQTKDQTRLIAQGVQKGISAYKKQQKSKARELDRKSKKISHQTKPDGQPEQAKTLENGLRKNPWNAMRWLPWGLLAFTWLGILGYFIFE